MPEYLAQPDKAPRCTHCAHYYITHDQNFVHGCRALNFRSKQLPEYAVMAESGMRCLAFASKKPKIPPAA